MKRRQRRRFAFTIDGSPSSCPISTTSISQERLDSTIEEEGMSSPTPIAHDHSRAITASLFSSVPGSNAPPNETFITYCPTWEDGPPAPNGSVQKKARFLIVAAARDGRLRLHKAKQNSNGSFSIGKTWPLEELRQVEVAKRMVEGFSNPQPLEFVLTLGSKSYRYKTEMPSSQQAAFLVTTVRCWRRFMAGRGPDLVLLGFAVDTNPSSSASSLPRSRTPTSSNNQSPSSFPQSVGDLPAPQRPPSASSNLSTGSRRPQAAMMVPPHSPSVPPLSTARPRDVSAQSNYRIDPSSSSTSSGRPSPSPINTNALPPPSIGGTAAARTPTPTSLTTPVSANRQPNSPVLKSPFGAGYTPTAVANNNASSASRNELKGAPPKGASSAGGAGSNRDKRDIHKKLGERKKSNFIAAHAQGLQINAMNAEKLAANSSGSGPEGSVSPPPTSTTMTTGGSSSSTPKPKPVEEFVDDETVLMNVEEMLEGFEWRGSSGSSSIERASWQANRRGGGRADEIEKRLIGELKALEAASIHAIMESDDRVPGVVKLLDDALGELDRMDLVIGMYKTQLNLMTDDIAHIESQNRGLQVQTSNQRQLLAELDKLMSTIHIPEEDLAALAQESLESQVGIERLERAAVSLYKALLSTRDTAVGDMAAASERVGEYRNSATRFSKRIYDFLSIMFKFQVDQILNPKDSKMKTGGNGKLPNHNVLEEFLGRYCGLMLFVKEIDFERYELICDGYYTVMSDLYRSEIQDVLSTLRGQIRKVSEEELDASFSAKESPTLRQQSIRRAGTLVNRSPMDGGKKDKDKDGKITASEAFGRALSEITPHIQREQGFISDFLHVNSLDASITFADYMVLETFFRRGATQHLNQNHAKMKDVKASMELVFKFLEKEMKDWIDGVLRIDAMQIIGIIAALDRFIIRSEEDRNEFLLRLLQRQHSKSITTLDRLIKEQTKSIEQTKLTLKKRKGVVPFVRVFPNFVARVEGQLEGCDDLPIRDVVNANYERIATTMFDCLQQMAKMDGEGQGQGGEGKDQLNYHVILIENMHHIIAVFSKRQKVAAIDPFVAQAKSKYTQNLDAYIRLIIRRPLARPLDFFSGLESLLRTTPPNEVGLHAAYTKAAVRRALADLRAKDVRKAIEGLYKRVDKHFGGDVSHQAAEHSEVLKTVWKACEEEMQRLTIGWKELLTKCYADDKLSLEFGTSDISEFCRKAQTA